MKRQTFLPDEYRPAEDEPFMNDRQLEYFRRKLLAWKQELLDQSAETLEVLQDSGRNVPDIADRASEETDRALELRTRDRQRKVVSKIDAALRRIEDGSYGYCEETGEPISLTYQHVNADIPLPSSVNPSVPPELDAIVLHALTKDRDERYPDARAMAEDLGAFRGGMPISPVATERLDAATH